MNTNTKISFKKYLLIVALGFGLGGALWGWVLYQGIPRVQFPFHFMAILIMGLLGGISLVLFSNNIREYSKSVLAGFLGWGIGFIAGGVLSYPLFASGILLLSVLPFYFIDVNLLRLIPNISIGDFWLIFLLIGAIIGLFFLLFLKTKKWALIWRTAVGLALASIISPIIGNLVGNLFNSLLISYLITFILIGAISGLSLGWGIYKYKK